MENLYNVLWIDDQHEALPALHRTARDYGIKLVPFKSMNGGCSELENNLHLYDAVLLDAKFFENEDDVSGTEDTQWVYDTKDRIRDLDKSLKYFVLTGQAITYASEEFNKAFRDVFEKGRDKDVDELFKLLVQSCEVRELTKLRIKYGNIIALCSEEYIGRKHLKRILKIIQDIESPDDITNSQDLLNPLRKILEATFKKLNQIGCIPDEIFNSQGWINASSYFLGCHNKNYSYHQAIVHPVIAENIHRLLNIIQDASHDEGSKLGVDEYITTTNNDYLYQSAVYLLLDILDWIKPFLDANSNKEKNLLKWTLITTSTSEDWMRGLIVRIADNGFGTFKLESSSETISIVPKTVKEYDLSVNDVIEVIIQPSPDGLKKFIQDIKKIAE